MVKEAKQLHSNNSRALYWPVSEVAQSCLTLATPWTAAYHLWDFLGKSTGVGCHCLLRINLLDTVKLSFRKLHHFMLSQQHMSTHFPTSHPQFRGNIWYYSMLSLNFCQFSWWQVIFHYCFGLHFFLPIRFNIFSCFLVIFIFLLSNLHFFLPFVYFVFVFYWVFHLLFLF